MKKQRWAVLAMLVLALGGLVLKTLWDAGQFKRIEPHFAGRCTSISGIPGVEDITFHPTLGYAYLSSDDRRAARAGRPIPGGIYRYDPEGTAEPVLLTGSFSKDFHPHGLSLFVDPSGAQTLFVVNHPEAGGHAIERFEVQADGQLLHRETIRDPALVSPNDLVAIDARRFYVTNDHHYPPGFMQKVEEYLQLAMSNVLFYDGQGFREVFTGGIYSNGINRSADGKTIYLAEVVGRAISIFDRDPNTHALHLRERIGLGSGPDNIEVDAQGRLWIGAHPKLLSFVAHSADEKKRAPSQVLRLSPSGASFQEPEEIFLDDGQKLSGAATAAVFGKRMLLGPVLDRRFLNCELP
ncbi:MAG: strictosidine synthase family protein [Myxococcaceae bacterium]|nr:strictosidine synthase family protein [Myxococcaceae bacterium]